jgi:hypothetical protein
MFEAETRARTREADSSSMGVLSGLAAVVSLYHVGKLLWGGQRRRRKVETALPVTSSGEPPSADTTTRGLTLPA